MVDLGADHALFSISVAAEVTGVNPPMLRVYEQKGLLEPHRTQGGTRRYSGQELDRISEIATLLEPMPEAPRQYQETGPGQAARGRVEHVLRLQAENHRLQREVNRLQDRGRKAAKAPTARPKTTGG